MIQEAVSFLEGKLAAEQRVVRKLSPKHIPAPAIVFTLRTQGT